MAECVTIPVPGGGSVVIDGRNRVELVDPAGVRCGVEHPVPAGGAP
jgi:hypothetical protein